VNARTGRWIVLAATIGCMAVTFRLGLWQLDRAAQKEALQQAMDSRAADAPLQPGELAASPAQAALQHHRRIRLQGHWLSEHTVYLENRQMHGRPGFYVLTPLRLDAGDAVVVQRGWLPRDLQDRQRIPAFGTATGRVAVSGRIAAAPSRLTTLGAEASGPIRQNVDLDAYARAAGVAMRPLSVVELPNADNAADGLSRDWPQPAVDVQKHYGYAVQWFVLCLTTAALYVWFQIIRPRRAAAAA
jgi:surfeit locus 1 family protein